MDGPRFDAWTRRRFGIVAGGALTSLPSLWELHDAEAKRKKKRKKRCRKLGQGCKSSGKKRRCCGNLACNRTDATVGSETYCCRDEGQSCQVDADCCDAVALGCAPDNTCKQVMVISDRALKTNVGSVDGRDMLDRLRQLPITTWNYTSDEATIRHIGPMAQDFAAAFGVGADDRHIHPVDGQGVALSAIQGLIAELDAVRAENARLAARVAAVELEAQSR